MQNNLGTVDRGLRAALGLVLIAATVFGFIGAWGWLGGVLLATAFFGFCPAYALFNWHTNTAETQATTGQVKRKL
jgi:nicotinamide riboside transporter PnuC